VSYGERVGAPARGSRQVQSQAAMRAAEAGEGSQVVGEAARVVRDTTNGAGEEGAAELRAPVEHYDDLAADEIVGLVDSLEGDDLAALLDYERAHESRPRVVSAIEGVVARRRTGQRG
jgi:hypothetical protein